jgi:16S rRNA A1518/A1519 N6-dimethyltransferase RsmA/KsgA/DIM1 with predicted DNA glycosylase/AP lyase activity
MRADLAALLAPYFEQGRVSVCANLPYYITTPILMKLLESGLPFHNITVMIQSEVADRLCSPVGGKDCGAITAVLNYYGVAERLFVVPASDFLPPPSVNSAVVRIRLHDKKPFVPKNDELFRKTIRVAFEQRRNIRELIAKRLHGLGFGLGLHRKPEFLVHHEKHELRILRSVVAHRVLNRLQTSFSFFYRKKYLFHFSFLLMLFLLYSLTI